MAIVTGGGSGIGGAIASRFGKEGAAVLVADLDPQRSANVVGGIEESGGRTAYLKVDATSERAAVREASSEQIWGKHPEGSEPG